MIKYRQREVSPLCLFRIAEIPVDTCTVFLYQMLALYASIVISNSHDKSQTL